MNDEASLVGGGDCFAHWHSQDRQPSQDFLHGLHQLAKVVVKSGNYAVQKNEDFVLVSGIATVTLPLSNNGQEYTVVRIGTGYVTVATTGADTVCGDTSVVMTTRWMSLTFKAVSGGWVIV